MFCENCGTNIPDSSSFCSGCGASVSAAAAPPPPPPPQQRPVPPVYAPPPVPPVYAPPQQQPYYGNQAAGYGYSQANCEPLGVGSYIFMFILTGVPIVGIIMLLVWAFGSGVNLNKKNFARAILLMFLVLVGIGFILFQSQFPGGLPALKNMFGG
ncbi:MAG: zinc ribbon domain-containing protein [Synergistaceae bacterium]|nr:zinc ribbon domain-containing protein [Synergistaceae bacterium]